MAPFAAKHLIIGCGIIGRCIARARPSASAWSSSHGRFARCRKLMQHESFAGHVAAVRKG